MRRSGRVRSAAVSAILVLLLAIGALLAAGCGSKEETAETPGARQEDTAPSTAPSTPDSRTFTLQELASFDGKNGNSAYVAVDGVVYDVTGSDDWPGGDHTPCNLDAAAGKDLSEIIKQAPPAMRTYIEARPVVGSL